MKKLCIIVISPILLWLSACISNRIEHDITFEQVKVFETAKDFSAIRVLPTLLKLNPVDSSIHLYFQDLKSNKLFSCSLTKDSLVPNNDLDFANTAPYYSYFIKSSDSIFVYHNEPGKLELLNKSGTIIKEYPVDTMYVPVATPPSGLVWDRNSILMGYASKTKRFQSNEERHIYYNEVEPLIRLSISDTILSYQLIGKFPVSYAKNGDSFYGVMPSVCCGKDNDICLSYEADNNLYLYHDTTLILTKPVKSLYIDKFNPYPDEKRFDMLFLQDYLIGEPKYKKIVYDPYDSLYYRIVKHRAKKTKEGKMRSSYSVIILDSNLTVLDEIKLGADLFPEVFIPTPFGILMEKESAMQPGNAVLTLQKLMRNDK